MSARPRPQVVVFDVVETLASLDPVADRLAEHSLDRSVLAGWFTRLLRDAMALTAAGGYAGFAEVAAAALLAETHGELSPAQLKRVVAGFGELTAQPDAVEAVRAAREAASSAASAAVAHFQGRSSATPPSIAPPKQSASPDCTRTNYGAPRPASPSPPARTSKWRRRCSATSPPR